MRYLFSVLVLLMGLGVMGWLAKSQLSGRAVPVQPPVTSAPTDTPPVPSGAPADIQQQYRKALDAALQQPRPTQDP